MKEREYLLELYETYKDLLSSKKQLFFNDYYYEDLSLQELADNYKVSKAYVSKIINNIEKELNNYEDSLHICSRNKKIKDIIKDIPNDIKDKIEELL